MKTMLKKRIIKLGELLKTSISVKGKKTIPHELRFFADESDFLLVVSKEAIEKASRYTRFRKSDFSIAWYNTIFQEVGNCSVVDVSSLTLSSISSRRVVIVSKSASSRIDSEQKRYLRDFLEGGNILILEVPDKNLSELGCFCSRGSKARKITGVSGVFGRIFKKLEGIPLNTKRYLLNFVSGRSDFRILLSVDDTPGIASRKVGEGILVVVAFDFARQIVAFQQGVPADDFSIIPRPAVELAKLLKDESKCHGLVFQKGKLKRNGKNPTDLLYNKKFFDADFPFSDLLEMFLLRVIESNAVIPKLSKSRTDTNGTLIVTHDEESYGDRVTFMSDYEAKKRFTSTFFVTPLSHISPKNIRRMLAQGIDIQLHWLRFRIFGVKLGLAHQLRALKNRLPGGCEIMANRVHGLQIGKHYSRFFNELLDNGIVIDSTYGANSFGKGYLFGTGLPFYPVDDKGSMLNVLELPFQVYENHAGADVKFLKRLLRDCAKLYSNTIVALYHPEEKPVNEWKKIFKLGRINNLWITNIKDYCNFMSGRSRTSLRSEVIGDRTNICVDAKSDNLAIEYYLNGKINRINCKKGKNRFVIK
jgi:hypothetical protein